MGRLALRRAVGVGAVMALGRPPLSTEVKEALCLLRVRLRKTLRLDLLLYTNAAAFLAL